MNMMRSAGGKRLAFVLVVLAASLFAGIQSNAQARPPQILISWRAQSYVPVSYPGKVLPSPNSTMRAAVQVIQGGKAANLSDKTIRWYIDGSLISVGTGNSAVSFSAPGRAAPSSFELSVQIPGYPVSPVRSDLLFGVTIIPVAGREVAIEAPYPDLKFSGQSFTVTGLPYFFNVKNPSGLEFLWTVNGQVVTSTEDKEELTVNLSGRPSSDFRINVRLVVRDPKDALYVGSKNINLIFVR